MFLLTRLRGKLYMSSFNRGEGLSLFFKTSYRWKPPRQEIFLHTVNWGFHYNLLQYLSCIYTETKLIICGGNVLVSLYLLANRPRVLILTDKKKKASLKFGSFEKVWCKLWTFHTYLRCFEAALSPMAMTRALVWKAKVLINSEQSIHRQEIDWRTEIVLLP